jgi:hypothetical protein
MWTAPGEIVIDRERNTAQSPKFMLMVVWNPIGLYVPKALPKECKFNAQYYSIIQMILGHNLRLEEADRGNTAEQVVGAF